MLDIRFIRENADLVRQAAAKKQVPCDMDRLQALAQTHGLRLIEDAAHAFGSTYKGRKIGGFGDVTCFSFDSTAACCCSGWTKANRCCCTTNRSTGTVGW